MTKIIAPKLNYGDTIAFFSPSTPATSFAPKRFERAKCFLISKGFKILAGNLTGKSDYYRSGSIEERVNELNELIRNPKVKCIMSTIGGSNSSSLLPYIDFTSLENNPKIIIGYSDVTSILLGIYAKINLITYYGPALVASFGEYPPVVNNTYDYFIQVLHNKYLNPKLVLPAQWTDEIIDWETQEKSKQLIKNNCTFHGKGKISGRLIGGNLNTITSIWGSSYMPNIIAGDILFIEDSLKDIATVERLFIFLKLNNVFDTVSGIILGKHELFDDNGTGRTPFDVLKEILNEQFIPIINNFDCCHTHPMFTLPIGGCIEIDFDNKQVKLNEF